MPLQEALSRAQAGSAASATPPIAKEPLHEVVGSLGLNEQSSVASWHDDRIGKELVPILVDLFDHGLPVGGGIVIGAGSQSLAELLNGLSLAF